MRNSELEGDTFARPNKLRNRKNLRVNPLSVAPFVSPLPKKFALQYFSGALLTATLYLVRCANSGQQSAKYT